jgi:hypothetical protein
LNLLVKLLILGTNLGGAVMKPASCGGVAFAESHLETGPSFGYAQKKS